MGGRDDIVGDEVRQVRGDGEDAVMTCRLHDLDLGAQHFPEAGEQVILLSTDTEVDADFYSILQPEVSHAFEINFDEATRCSSVTEGYFWENQRAETA